jgi:hypothetical protein
MYNLIVLGSGRSGTSMAAGLFHKSGYFMGDNLYAGRAANPKGFFEDEEINGINERILHQVLLRRPKGIIGNLLFRKRLGEGHSWLARVPLGTPMPCPSEVGERIRALTARKPFCFKDPRFSYTLPCWQPFLENARFLVIFRHPADTAKSVAKECKDSRYLHNLSISNEEILQTWQLMYSHVLQMRQTDGCWLFLHYDQMLDPAQLDRLESFADVEVDRSFPDKSLKRSISTKAVPPETNLIYQQLCELANYHAHAATCRELSI